jgi:VanZ family protein
MLKPLWYLSIAAVVTGSLLSPNSTPIRILAATHLSDKLLHFAAYALLAFLPAAGLAPRRRAVAAALSMVVLGLLLEFAQRLSPGRATELGDEVANTAGVLAGIVLAQPFRRLLHPCPQQQPNPK